MKSQEGSDQSGCRSCRGRVMGVALVVAVVCIGVLLYLYWNALHLAASATDNKATVLAMPARVVGDSPEQVGRYLVMVSGCNDCHTPGFAQGVKVPESDWLTGVPVGWRGPWGTSYAANLRLFVQQMDEQGWVAMSRSRDGLPPMPWATLHAMSDQDLRAVYRYIKSLGPQGETMPVALGPDETPAGLWVSMIPQGSAKPDDSRGGH